MAIVVAVMLVMQLAPSTPASAADDATLTQDVTPEDPPYNGNLSVSSVSAFNPDGGTAVFEPDTASEETFTYTSTDPESLILTGVRRESPATHPAGSVVAPAEPGAETTPPPATPVPSTSPTTDDGGQSAEPSAAAPDEPGSDPSSGADVAGASQASSAGVIPGPCDIAAILCSVVPPIGCEGCDSVVDAVLEMVSPCLEKSEGCAEPVMTVVSGLIYEACGSDDLLYCDDKVAQILAAVIDDLCAYGLTTCADPYINLVADAIMGIVCPSGSLGYCAGEISRQVNEQLAFVVGVAKSFVVYACGGETANDCANRVLDILYRTVLPIVCQASDVFTCVDNTADKINDLVANTCALDKGATDTSEASAVTECVNRVLTTVQLVITTAGDAMIIACGSSEPNTCLANLIARVNIEINRICLSLPGSSYSTGLNECIDKTLQVVNSGVALAQEVIRDTCGSEDPRRCVEMAVNEAFVMLDKVNDLVANTCKQNIGATTSTSDSAVTACVDRVLATVASVQQLVAQKMVEVCGSADPNTCVANLVTRVNVEINRICASLPGDGNTTGLNECIDKALQVVDAGVELAKKTMRDTCGSDDPNVCAAYVVNQLLLALDRVNDLITNTCKQDIGATTSTSDSAVTACIDRVLATVASVQQLVAQRMVEVCGSADPNACLANLVMRINIEITRMCSSVPGTDYSSGASRCAARTLEIVNDLVARARAIVDELCPSGAVDGCTAHLAEEISRTIEMVNDTIANACRGYISDQETDGSAGESCVDRAMDLAQGLVATVCGDGDDVMLCIEGFSPEELIQRLQETLCADIESAGCGGTVPTNLCGLLGLRACDEPPQIGAGGTCDQEETSGFCTDEPALEANPCVPTSVCQDAPPMTPEFQESCNAVSERCTSYVVPSGEAPPEQTPEDGGADGESGTALSKPVGKTTSIYRWYYEKGKPQAYGICKYNEDGSLDSCKEVGTMKFGGVIELRGRRSYWKQWTWGLEGPPVKATHLWNCTDDNTGSPFGDTSCSDGWEERTNDEYTLSKWWRPDGGYSVYHAQDELYFYSFYYEWKADGHGNRKWRFPEKDMGHHRYSLKFECYEGWGPSDEAGECRFAHEV
jgi:hypothetical protein